MVRLTRKRREQLLSPCKVSAQRLPDQATVQHLRMAKLLANKVVVITGSSQGIGRATAIGKRLLRICDPEEAMTSLPCAIGLFPQLPQIMERIWSSTIWASRPSEMS